MKNDSPLRTLRLSDFMKPPSAFDSISTPPEWAIIAPDSARHSSPGPSWARHTAKAGLCRTVISIEFLQGVGGHAAVAYAPPYARAPTVSRPGARWPGA